MMRLLMMLVAAASAAEPPHFCKETGLACKRVVSRTGPHQECWSSEKCRGASEGNLHQHGRTGTSVPNTRSAPESAGRARVSRRGRGGGRGKDSGRWAVPGSDGRKDGSAGKALQRSSPGTSLGKGSSSGSRGKAGGGRGSLGAKGLFGSVPVFMAEEDSTQPPAHWRTLSRTEAHVS